MHILEFLLLLLYLLPVDTEMPSKQAITGVAVCVVVMIRQGKERRGDTNPRPKSINQVLDGKEQIPTVGGHLSVSTDWMQKKHSRIPLHSILKPCSTHLLQCLLVIASSIDRSVRPTSLNERMTDHSIVLQTNCRHPTLTARLPSRRLPLSIQATSSSCSATLSIILPTAFSLFLSLHPTDQHVALQVRLSLHKHIINF